MNTEVSSAIQPKERKEQIRSALAIVLSSRLFQSSPLMTRLLTFLVEEDLAGHTGTLKETYVGHVLYGRPATYDPKLDSIVRVNANRLRGRLLEYYAGNPTASPRIVIRPGSYVPVYEFTAITNIFEGVTGQTVTGPTIKTLVMHEGILNGYQLPAISVQEEQPPTHSALWIRRHWAAVLGSLVLCFILAVALAGLLRGGLPKQAIWTAEPFSNLGGVEEFAAISPDGQHVAYSWQSPFAQQHHIYLQAMTQQTPVRLTASTTDERRPAWSPDGTSMAFLRITPSGDTEVIVRLLDGKREEKVADLHGTYPWLCTIPRLSWTPDGKKILTSDRVGVGDACGVVAINVETHSVQPLTQPPPGSIGDLETTVSPNGSQIGFLRNAGTLGGDIYVVPIEGGAVRRVTFDNRDIMGFCWNANGSGFIASSRRGDGIPRLWQVPLDGKTTKTLTDGLTLAAFPSLSPRGDRMVFTTYHTATSIWQVSNGARKMLVSDQSNNSTPQLSPDGKSLVYRSDRTGAFELWISKLNQQIGMRLTTFKGPMVNNPRWSPDGTQIVFECRPQGQSDICMISPEHPADVHLLTHWTSNEIFPSWSHDGRSIFFASNYSGRWEIYQKSINSGDPVAITHEGGMRALQSRDGQWLYIFRDESPRQLVRVPLSEEAGRRWEAGRPTIMSDKFDSDMIGKWDIGLNGVLYIEPIASDPGNQVKAIAIDGESKAHHEIGRAAGPLPSGDLIFSTSPDQSFVYVKQELQQGDIGLLVREPAGH